MAKSRTTLYLQYFSFVQSLLALMGSLIFSEVFHFPPCVLCWYQRIAIYPLVAIIATGIVLKDKRLPYYVLPLSLTGLGVSIYHNLLYYGIIPESIAPCVAGVSCTTQFFTWFGFITIPFLSMLAFLSVTVSQLLILKISKSE